MGTHVTFVRSTDLDEWTADQILCMKIGGNGPAREYFKKNGVSDMHTKTEKKYNSRAARMYRDHLKSLVAKAQVTAGFNAAADAESEVQNGSQQVEAVSWVGVVLVGS